MQNRKKRTRTYWIVGLLIVVAIMATALLANRPNPTETETANRETVVAFVGDLSARATASGQIQPSHLTTLSVAIPGRVTAVNARVGDLVEAGQVLVQLDTDDLALSVAIAEQILRLKETQLASLRASPKAAEIAAAQAAVTSARLQLDELLAGPSAAELAAQEADLRAAEANVRSSSAQLSQTQNSIKAADIAAARAALAAAEANLKNVEIQYTRNPAPDDLRANTALAQAREQLASAQAGLDLLLAGPDPNLIGSAQASLSSVEAQRDATEAQLSKSAADPSPATVAAMELQLAQATAALANLQQATSTEQIAAAEAEVAQANISLADAQEALENATIMAPYEGLVTALHVSEGEFAAGPVLELIDGDSLEVVLEVDEVDLGGLAVGQAATVFLEAWPDMLLTSQITKIAHTAVTAPGSSLVVYQVSLGLNPGELPILIGMTADANLITAEKKDVLLVPNRAIKVDRANGTYSVDLLLGDSVENVPVSIGLRDSQYTEITSGLNAGDEIVVGSEVPRVTFGPDGGGGGPFGGNN